MRSITSAYIAITAYIIKKAERVTGVHGLSPRFLFLDHELHSELSSDGVVEAAERVAVHISLVIARIEVIGDVEDFQSHLQTVLLLKASRR